MSDADHDQHEGTDGDDGPGLDNSFRVDTSTLSAEELDFARQMGFGSDGSPGADSAEDEEEAPPPARTASKKEPEAELQSADASAFDDDGDEADDADDEDGEDRAADDEVDAASDDEAEDVHEAKSDAADAPTDREDEDEDDARAIAETAPAEPPRVEAPMAAPAEASEDADAREWEEVAPRPAKEGMQTTLSERADEVLAREAIAATHAEPAGSGTSAPEVAALRAEVEALRTRCASLLAAVEASGSEVEDLRAAAAKRDPDAIPRAELDKIEERLRSEIDTLGIERDQLIDQLAATSGQLVQAQGRAEKLEASLKAARGALIPLPEGERALRAEVVGLRGRLEDALEDQARLASRLSATETDLAIAQARIEDRQHEIDHHADRAAELEARLEDHDGQLAEALEQHREVLALAARLQAENNELRSTQAALEETLSARDLEITAREEHLAVMRRGLATRDAQILDLRERLDQVGHRTESLETELERRQLDLEQLQARVERREVRIATLTETLGRIEQAMGRGIGEISLAPPSPARSDPMRTVSQRTLVHPTSRTRPARTPRAPSPAPTPAAVDATDAAPEPDDDADDRAGSASVGASKSLPGPESMPARPPVDAPVRAPETKPIDDAKPAAEDVTSAAPHAQNACDDDFDVDVTETLDDAPIERDATPDTPPAEPILAAPARIPPILSSWRDRCFGEIAGQPELVSVHAYLAERLEVWLGTPGPEFVYLRSLGGSLPEAEVRLVQALHALGRESVRLEVLDRDPACADARRQKIELAGLGEIIEVVTGDLDVWRADAPCHAILLSDALEGQPELDRILDHCETAMRGGALLLFAGRVGSGPLQLSASTLIRLEELWSVLPDSLIAADGLCVIPHRGDDGGASRHEPEPADRLLERFEPIVLGGMGHLVDLVVGPARGFALSPEDPESMRLLESIMAIDESRTLTEHLTARHGVGLFALDAQVQTPEQVGQPWPAASRRS